MRPSKPSQGLVAGSFFLGMGPSLSQDAQRGPSLPVMLRTTGRRRVLFSLRKMSLAFVCRPDGGG